jgi:hypothetical protein
MKLNLILLVAVLSLSIGCHSKFADRLVGNPEPKPDLNAWVQDFTGSAAPTEISLNLEPQNPTTSIQAAFCINSSGHCIVVAPNGNFDTTIEDPRAFVPVYAQIQPSLTTPYAYWNFTSPNLQVVFKNLPSSYSYLDAQGQQVVVPVSQILWLVKSHPQGA